MGQGEGEEEAPKDEEEESAKEQPGLEPQVTTAQFSFVIKSKMRSHSSQTGFV